ncbi:MAG TPA: lasso peptide biosynthesis B2 protein [Steroidobacter sp.]|uniref:lasso peptide biosynthesis B2 protein n=1 Tax=Steroidobacter sp. TaxID=1978227 RepID=UPI002EDAD0ED
MDETADYYLARHAYVCVLRDRMVLLDTASGKYLALDASSACSLRKHVSGWPQLESANANEAALDLLLKRQLLTRNPSRGKPATPVQVLRANAWLGEVRPAGCPDLSARQVWRFFRATTIAHVSKRAARLDSIVRRLSRRKAAHHPHRSVPLETLDELVRAFDWLLPLAFDKKDNCFLYCLALAEFLAYHRIFPDWIFGVQDQPFRAHCWLQYREHMLTDIPFWVRELTPIMVV